MSHTPLDGPDSGSQDGAESADGSAPGGGFRGLVRRVRGLLQTVADAVGRSVGTDDDDRPDRPQREPTDDSGETARRIERSLPLADGDDAHSPVLSDRRRERALPATAEDGPRERPELVARWHDDRLTLSEPDETGAQISSDTWSEVDP